jgi:hypothetical protein
VTFEVSAPSAAGIGTIEDVAAPLRTRRSSSATGADPLRRGRLRPSRQCDCAELDRLTMRLVRIHRHWRQTPPIASQQCKKLCLARKLS